MSRCHNTPFTSLAATVPKSDNSKACLFIELKIKKTGNSPWPHLPCYCVSTCKDRGCFPLCQCKDSCNFGWFLLTSIFGIPSGVGPVIPVNQNLLTVSFLTNRFIIAVLLLTYVANSEKEYKLVTARLLLVSRVSSDSIFLGWSTPHVINTILRHYARFWIFLAGIFRSSQRETRGSRLELQDSQNNPPAHHTSGSCFIYFLCVPKCLSCFITV